MVWLQQNQLWAQNLIYESLNRTQLVLTNLKATVNSHSFTTRVSGAALTNVPATNTWGGLMQLKFKLPTDFVYWIKFACLIASVFYSMASCCCVLAVPMMFRAIFFKQSELGNELDWKRMSKTRDSLCRFGNFVTLLIWYEGELAKTWGTLYCDLCCQLKRKKI